jgi:hypothetical protein
MIITSCIERRVCTSRCKRSIACSQTLGTPRVSLRVSAKCDWCPETPVAPERHLSAQFIGAITVVAVRRSSDQDGPHAPFDAAAQFAGRNLVSDCGGLQRRQQHYWQCH